MHVGRIVFAQLIDHIPPYEFQKCVERYGGNYKFRGFSCLDQFLCLAFAQLTYRESLRDIEACLRSWAFEVGFPDPRWPMPTKLTTGILNPHIDYYMHRVISTISSDPG